MLSCNQVSKLSINAITARTNHPRISVRRTFCIPLATAGGSDDWRDELVPRVQVRPDGSGSVNAATSLQL